MNTSILSIHRHLQCWSLLSSLGLLVLYILLLIGCESADPPLAPQYTTQRGGSSDMMGDQPFGGTGEMIAGRERSTGGTTGVGDPSGGMPMGGSTPVEMFSPAEPTWARLTQQQYRNTLFDLFQDPLEGLELEPDTNPFLFDTIGATSGDVSARGVELYLDAATAVASAYVQREDLILETFGCVPESINDGCVDQLIRETMWRAYRRPVEEAEVQRWLDLSNRFAEGRWQRGVETALIGILSSPHFLYREELGEPDPIDSRPNQRRYTDYELASRLSYLILNSTPDDALLSAAERGELVTDEGLRAQTERLLDHPKARPSTQSFFAQYLDLGRLDHIERDLALYPEYSPQLIKAMRMEVELLVNDLVYRQDGDIRRLFSDARGYVNQDLAALYGVSVEGLPAGVYRPIDFTGAVPRAGILNLGAFLTMNAHPSETSPTLRGKYIRERVLCQEVPAPPDDIDLNLDPDPGEPRTLRERLEQHRADPACSGCHSFIDPPGFLFEHFDSMGRYREMAEGFPIDASGSLDGTPLDDARGLGALLKEDDRMTQCLVRQLFRHASGRLETLGEQPSLEAIHDRFEEGDFRFRALMLALVMSDGFRLVAPVDSGEE